MKSSLSIVLFLVLPITSQSIFSTSISAASPGENVVKDATGKKVLDNVRYHIGPVSAKGGIIKLKDTMNNKKVCPFNVVQDPAEKVGGEFMFTLIGKEKYLRTSRILGIDSGLITKGECTKSTFWTILDPEGEPPSNLITTGGPFEEDITCFQVVEYPKPTSPKVHSYMLQHCPYFCGAGPSTCFNISIYSDNGVRRLSAAMVLLLLSLCFIRFPIK